MNSNDKFRRIALFGQGLMGAPRFGKGPGAVQTALEHLGYIQIDTLSVVERAHHHALWSRIPDYRPEYLHQMVGEGAIFEYWFHAASYLPMRDYRFALPRMAAIQRGESAHFAAGDTDAIRYVRDRIRSEGPLKARDFESPRKNKGSWWNWKPAKHALETLFMRGELMVAARNGMEKIHDLRERVLPPGVDTREPAPEEFAEYLVNSFLKAHGFCAVKQMTHLRPGSELRKNVEEVLRGKIEAGQVTEVVLPGMPGIYMEADSANLKLRAPAAKVHLLSPFDNAVIHRDRVQALFGFDYKLECYTPAAKRRFGYFCLPILYKDKLVGRVDCKAHRKTNHLELLHLHIEDAKVDLDAFLPSFDRAMKRFARFNDCGTVSVTKVSPAKWFGKFRGLAV